MSIVAPLACASASDCTVPGTRSMSPNVATRTPCRASSTPSSTSGTSVTQTGQPGPMITLSFFGKSERNPNFAIACSCEPQTCMTDTSRPISRISASSCCASARASSGSRKWSAGVSPAASGRLARSRSWSPGGTPDDCGLEVRAPSDIGRFDLAEDVGGHRIVLVALGEERFVQRQRLDDRVGRNAADGEADVIENVVADRHMLVEDVETDLAAHAPEVDGGHAAVDVDHFAGDTETHARFSVLVCATALAMTAWPSAMPPSPGGTSRPMKTRC